MARKRSGISSAVIKDKDGLSSETFADLQEYQLLTAGSLAEVVRILDVKDKREQITRAITNRNEDDLIGSIIDTKVEFYSSGFGIQVNPKSGIDKAMLRERVNQEIIQKFEINKVVEELIDDFCSCDNAILVWAVNQETKELLYVTSLDPSRAEYINAMGVEMLKVVISDDVKAMINAALNDKMKLSKLEKSMKKYVDAVRKGESTVTLSNKDGEYWIVKTESRRFTGLARPSMVRIFLDIVLRKMLVQGDWTLAYQVKRIIEIIQMGESITNGPHAGTKRLYQTDKEVAALKRIFNNNTSQALRLFVNHTFKMSNYAPDAQLFTEEKFKKVEQRILRWGGVIDTIMTGEGEGYSQGYIGARRFVAQGLTVRRSIGEMIEKFILHPSVAPQLKIPAGSTATITWDEQNLKDYKQILDEVTALFDRGAMDIETLLERMGYNYNLVKTRKKADWKAKDTWVPTYEPRQGLLGNLLGLTPDKTSQEGAGKPGRPNTGKNTEPANKPRPGRKGNS